MQNKILESWDTKLLDYSKYWNWVYENHSKIMCEKDCNKPIYLPENNGLKGYLCYNEELDDVLELIEGMEEEIIAYKKYNKYIADLKRSEQNLKEAQEKLKEANKKVKEFEKEAKKYLKAKAEKKSEKSKKIIVLSDDEDEIEDKYVGNEIKNIIESVMKENVVKEKVVKKRVKKVKEEEVKKEYSRHVKCVIMYYGDFKTTDELLDWFKNGDNYIYVNPEKGKEEIFNFKYTAEITKNNKYVTVEFDTNHEEFYILNVILDGMVENDPDGNYPVNGEQITGKIVEGSLCIS